MALDAPSYPFRSAAPLQPPAELARLRADRPVCPVTLPSGQTAWLVTRFEDVRLVLTDRRFSRRPPRGREARLTAEGGFGDFDSDPVAGTISEGPGHARWRRLLRAALTQQRVERMGGRVRSLAAELVAAAAAGPQPADLVQALAVPLPIAVISDLLGAPIQDRGRLWGWMETLLAVDGQDPGLVRSARAELHEYVRDLIASYRAGGADTLLAALVRARDGGDEWPTDDEVVFTVQAILMGGWGATAAYLGGTLLLLFAHPDQLAALRRDPGLAAEATEEGLRLFGGICAGFGLPRHAAEDVEIADTVVPKGSTVLADTESANRDERHLPHPERFDLGRGSAQHLTFSAGPHYCLGAPVARLAIEAALETLLRRCPRVRLAVPAAEVRISTVMAAQGPEALPVHLT